MSPCHTQSTFETQTPTKVNTKCLKLPKNVTFKAASEASYVYILSWLKMPKMVHLASFWKLENVEIEKLKWDILGDFTIYFLSLLSAQKAFISSLFPLRFLGAKMRSKEAARAWLFWPFKDPSDLHINLYESYDESHGTYLIMHGQLMTTGNVVNAFSYHV